MIQFANPAFLWGFLGLAIPLTIHLLNRKEGKLIRVGSLRHIRETSTRQFRSVKLNEIFLLALRSLLISLLVLLLSGASISFFPGSSKWLLIERGMERAPGLTPTIDSLQREGYELHFLAKGFPRLTAESPDLSGDYAELVEELGTDDSRTVLVLSYNHAAKFIGRREMLPQNVTWIGIEGNSNHLFPVSAIRSSESTVEVRMTRSSPPLTSMESIEVPAASNSKYFRSDIDSVLIRSRDTIHVVLAYGDAFARDASVMSAILKTLQPSSQDFIVWQEMKAAEVKDSPNIDWLIWFSDSAVPQTSAKTIIFEQQPGRQLLLKDSRSRYLITQRLNQENVVEYNLAIDIQGALFPASAGKELAEAGDMRSLDERMGWAPYKADHSGVGPGMQVQTSVTLLLMLILITLLAERALAYRRDQ